MNEAEYHSLRESIGLHGLQEPLVTDADTGELLDGRHRLRACQELGITPDVLPRRFSSEAERLDFVLDLNVNRRHLNESQRAMIGARMATMPSGARTDLASLDAMSQPEAAEEVNVSRISVQRAAVVLKSGSAALIHTVDEGKVPVSVAAKIARLSEGEQRDFVKHLELGIKPPHQILAAITRDMRRDAIEAGAQGESDALPLDRQYAVIYADPPWRYERQTMGHSDRRAENHYPTMSLDDICDLPVSLLATPDAVLFLWATVPCLEEALCVMKAWGFEYKSQFVWGKDKIGLGYHVRNQHELLLIGRRGNPPLPEPDARPPSLVIAPRGEHSQKPERFYELIEMMYPRLEKIELFSRSSRKGWQSWGYECAGAIRAPHEANGRKTGA